MASPFDTDDLRGQQPQTEDAAERGFVHEVDDEARGESDTDEAGDIADEGPGHRG